MVPPKDQPSDQPVHRLPVPASPPSDLQGYLNVFYNVRGWRTAQRFEGVPQPTQEQEDVVSLFESLAGGQAAGGLPAPAGCQLACR